jgi:predicted  nucleic acid-binding Zn-ribbon protein
MTEYVSIPAKARAESQLLALIENLDKMGDIIYDRLREVNDDLAQIQVKREGIYNEYEQIMQRRQDLVDELHELRSDIGETWSRIYQ